MRLQSTTFLPPSSPFIPLGQTFAHNAAHKLSLLTFSEALGEIYSDRWDVARKAKLGKKAAKRAAAAAAAAAAELPGKAKREEEDEEGEAYERAPRRRLREVEEGERAAALPVKVNGELLYGGGSANGTGVPQVAHPTKGSVL